MRPSRSSLAVCLTVATSATLIGGLPLAASAAPGDIPVQLLAFNDFHGRIAETTGNDSLISTGTGPDNAWGTTDDVRSTVGGAAHLAAAAQQRETAFGGANSFRVGVGDQIGASPFESSVFRDEPTIEVLNAMDVDVAVVGNHEFDRGTDELRRVSAATDGTFTDDVTACEGVTPGQDGCFPDSTGRPFAGSRFPQLAANVVSRDSGEPILPPYQVLDLEGGQRMALIGVVTDTTPGIVSPGGIADVEFLDETETVNRYVPELQEMGIEAIGVLLHEGATNGGADAADPNGCAAVTGPAVDINAGIDAAVDVVLSAHSHGQYTCLLPGPDGVERLVSQGGFYGRLLTDVRLEIDPESGDVDRAGTYSATNVPVVRNGAGEPTVAGIVSYWRAQSAAEGNEVIGSATADILRGGTQGSARDVESSLGNLVAQAQLEAVRQEQFGDPVVAFMNPGGLRADVLAGDVTYSEAFAVQPFGNTVNTTTLTGADIKQVLEEQFPSADRNSTLVLGTSEDFRYSYDPARAEGDRVDPCSITIDGELVDPEASYRVAANSFLITGGDFFSGFTNGTDPTTGPVDVDTAVAYFRTHSPVTPPATDHGTLTTERASCGPVEVPATASISDDTPLRGQQVTVTGRDFAPGERVTLTVGSTRLGSAVADQTGTAVLRGRVPLNAPAGQQQVTLTGDSGETATTTATLAPVAQDVRTVISRVVTLLARWFGR